ncbi:homeobox domain-domain-containing protein, partial [Syncephalastrum racemosum]
MSSSVASSPGAARILSVPAPPTPNSADEQQHPPTAAHKGNTIAKAKRKRITPQQFERLMEVFDQTDTPSTEIREKLADELGMTKREVQVWFQNRRAKM